MSALRSAESPIIEGPMPDYDSLAAGIAERILAVPRFRQVLRTHFFDLGPPEWVDDPTSIFPITSIARRFRIRATMRLCSASPPMSWNGDWIAIGHFGSVGSSKASPTADGRILMKIHHCIADGIATMHMFSGLSDGGAGDTFATEIRAAKESSESKRLVWPG